MDIYKKKPDETPPDEVQADEVDVSAEEKTGKHQAFIASLGRANRAGKEADDEQPEYIEEKSSPGKKIAGAILVVLILGAVAGGGYWFWQKKKQETVSQGNEVSPIVLMSQEKEKDEAKEEAPKNEDISIEEIKPAEIKIKVLNAGAPAGSAGKIKALLVGKGYTKAEAGNGAVDSTGTFIYYKGEKFKKPAEAVKEILAGGKVTATVKEALTAEQGSADIVVILGK